MGSDEGGLEELVELSFSLASRSLMRCSSSRTRPWTESNTARMAIWASGETVFQSGSGMGGRGIILLILRAYYTKGSVRERALVHLLEDTHLDLRARGRTGLRHVVPDRPQRPEDHPEARPGHMGEEPVLDRVVLRAVRRIVRHPDLEPQPIGQPLQLLLEDVPRGAVAPAAVAEHQQLRRTGIGRPPVALPPRRQAVAGQLAGVVAGVQVDEAPVEPHVVDPVGDHRARTHAAEVVVVDLDGALRLDHPPAVEVADQLLLLGVDADHRQSGRQVLALEPRDVL